MKKIKKLVVDADVARCASEKMVPVSSNARLLLSDMLNNRVDFCRCDKLKGEWKNHASRYSTTWLASMVSRKLVEHVEIDFSQYDEIIDSAQLTDGEKNAGKKDSHLLAIASSCDAVIASNDVTAFKVFHKVTDENGSFGMLSWLSPTLSIESFKDVLTNGKAIPEQWEIRCAHHDCL